MARPKNADGQRTRQAVLDAALHLFGERGFFGTTLRDVARAVGVRESALYNYFPSKEALFRALIAANDETKRERFAAAIDDHADDARTALERLTRHSLEMFADPQQRQLFRILMSDGLRLARAGQLNLAERIGAGRAPMRDAMQAFIDRGWLRPADPDLLALSFGGPLLAWRHLAAVDADLPFMRDQDAFIRQHVDTFLAGAGRTAERAAKAIRGRGPRPRPAASHSRRPTRARA